MSTRQMTVYDGRTPLGEILDYGPGRVLAVDFPAPGQEARDAGVSGPRAC
jgi:hypothetical protein